MIPESMLVDDAVSKTVRDCLISGHKVIYCGVVIIETGLYGEGAISRFNVYG